MGDVAATLSKARHDKVTSPEVNATWQRMGTSALAHFGEPSETQTHALPSQEGFNHLFPATQVPPELLLTETWSVEDAELLANKLPDGDPYRDYALSNLALHYLKSHDPTRAYDLMHQIENSALAVHVLTEVIFYNEDHPDEAIKDAVLKSELRTKAINAYFYDPSAENALALGEASEALEGDKEMRQYAKQAVEQHPEIQPDVEDDNDLQPPKLTLMKRFYQKLVR
ncbi:MAG TPA: hypothetical protein VFT59_03330 [Candidatus Saccharimonadales bacterium]|nr:hypothetical protein [Candidatus Saccharimonadales bacterium]